MHVPWISAAYQTVVYLLLMLGSYEVAVALFLMSAYYSIQLEEAVAFQDMLVFMAKKKSKAEMHSSS